MSVTVHYTVHRAIVAAENKGDRSTPGSEWTASMNSKMEGNGHRVNLVQYRRVNGKWQFVSVVKANGKPNPRLVLIDGEPTSYKGGANFFLDWREDGKRKRKSIGDSPRAALDEWQKATGVANGSIDSDPEPPTEETIKSLSVEDGVKQYLKTVKATKGAATHRAYRTDLTWAKKHLTRNIVSRIDRSDLITLFASDVSRASIRTRSTNA